jgi:hypothetical protein
MRRRTSFATAALAASGVVAVCVGAIAVSVSVTTATPGEGPVSADTSRVPPDLVWRWVVHCMQLSSEASSAEPISYTVGDAGDLSVEFGWADDQGHVTVDPRMAAVTKECIGEKTVELVGSASRSPTQAERLVLYDWTVERQQPCLAERGMNARVGSRADFLDERAEPWYLLNSYAASQQERGLGVDFDTLLRARLACPPMPASLAARGVG